MIEAGQPLPDIVLTADDGSTVSLSELPKPLVIYFYPRAFTPGCTTQACDFRDSHERWMAAGYTVVGISPDDPETLAKFRDEYDLPYSLLADPDHAAASAFGAWGEKKNYGKTYEGLIRSTFVTDADGVVTEAMRNVRAKGHVERLLGQVS